LSGLEKTVDDMVPEFAIVGHPNEGKSAVVSTLAEDDNVRVTPYPGETVECQAFPVMIDGQEIIRFIDTPGFQNPKKTLAWIKAHEHIQGPMLEAYLEAHGHRAEFRDDVRLMEPIARGAGIIYVVDGSRPVRRVDLAEMEILRLTGRPRMAIINCKEDETAYLDQWKREFRKHFNAIRVFNANKATYGERIELLENLKGIDQDWGSALDKVITAFKKDWEQRNLHTAEIICDLLEECLSFSITRSYTGKGDERSLEQGLREEFNQRIERMEKKAHEKIRRLFKHNIFNFPLPAQSILSEDLFSRKTWQFLGLTPRQLVAAAGAAGGAVGVALDLAAAGLTFGIFTAAGGLLGAGWAALGGGKRLARAKVVGLDLGGEQIRVGPINNVQFLYILLDRALIFYSHIINWAHGRRDYPSEEPSPGGEVRPGLVFQWDDGKRGVCKSFHQALLSRDERKRSFSRNDLKAMLQGVLLSISQGGQRSHGEET